MFAGFALLSAIADAQPSAPATSSRTNTAKPISLEDGRSPDTAYRVKSLDQEYEIMRSLGLTPKLQELVVRKGKSYDLLLAIDLKTGVKREIWFAISSFCHEC